MAFLLCREFGRERGVADLEGEFGVVEGEAVIEATGGVAGAGDVAGVEEAAKGAFGEGSHALGTRPGGVGVIEIVGTDGEGGIVARAAEFEEGGERVLIVLNGGAGEGEVW